MGITFPCHVRLLQDFTAFDSYSSGTYSNSADDTPSSRTCLTFTESPTSVKSSSISSSSSMEGAGSTSASVACCLDFFFDMVFLCRAVVLLGGFPCLLCFFDVMIQELGAFEGWSKVVGFGFSWSKINAMVQSTFSGQRMCCFLGVWGMCWPDVSLKCVVFENLDQLVKKTCFNFPKTHCCHRTGREIAQFWEIVTFLYFFDELVKNTLRFGCNIWSTHNLPSAWR